MTLEHLDDDVDRLQRRRTYPPPPYSEILVDLLKSTMHALADLQQAAQYGDLTRMRHDLINRHFAWLALVYPEGTNRHLFDGSPGISTPLRTEALRDLTKLKGSSEAIFNLLNSRKALPIIAGDESEKEIVKKIDDLKIIRREPTRISLLIKGALQEILDAELNAKSEALELESDNSEDDSSTTTPGVLLRSPLSIVCDYLTIPELPGTRSYALVALRNLLFVNIGTYPDGLSKSRRRDNFTSQQVEVALSRIWTSIRRRYWSLGKDKLSATGRRRADKLVRHFLALNGMLWLWFESPEARLAYCRSGDFFSDKPEFSRSLYLEKLPELGELVNEIWGVLLPIRGSTTIFRGGLKFSSRRGLVMAIHGGPGTGKTTLALALANYLAPFEIKTLYLTTDEGEDDLRSRAEGLVADEIRRASFSNPDSTNWLKIDHYKFEGGPHLLESLRKSLEKLSSDLKADEGLDAKRPPKPCKAIVVLDGLHDLLIAASQTEKDTSKNFELYQLHRFVDACRELQALVILTTGEEWVGEASLDYMVDVAVRLTHESTNEYGMKPDRRIVVTKARHQLCATGTHGIQIAGAKGVRFSPQINYQLDRRAVWKTRLPDWKINKEILHKTIAFSDLKEFPAVEGIPPPNNIHFNKRSAGAVDLPLGSSIFLNGKGSGGKAALALKMALAPAFESGKAAPIEFKERVLVVSFLYPEEYYVRIMSRLIHLRRSEYDIGVRSSIFRPMLNVIQLYPGYLKPNDLFNRILWELDAADMQGAPYTTIILDGIHNTFLQFPELEKYRLIWAQLYALLRTRPITIITTHTTFVMQGSSQEEGYLVADSRSETLRHALVQKTDFRIEVDPWSPPEVKSDGQAPIWSGGPGDVRAGLNLEPNIFEVRTISSINQPIPSDSVLWSRERLVLCEHPDSPELPLPAPRTRRQ